MPTEVMQITVPVEIAEQIRARVRSGEYATESDVVIDRFSDHDELDLSPEELDDAFRLGFEALEEMERHPETALTIEDMRRNLAEQHQRALQSR